MCIMNKLSTKILFFGDQIVGVQKVMNIFQVLSNFFIHHAKKLKSRLSLETYMQIIAQNYSVVFLQVNI